MQMLQIYWICCIAQLLLLHNFYMLQIKFKRFCLFNMVLFFFSSFFTVFSCSFSKFDWNSFYFYEQKEVKRKWKTKILHYFIIYDLESFGYFILFLLLERQCNQWRIRALCIQLFIWMLLISCWWASNSRSTFSSYAVTNYFTEWSKISAP